jgi:hypothetical protein
MNQCSYECEKRRNAQEAHHEAIPMLSRLPICLLLDDLPKQYTPLTALRDRIVRRIWQLRLASV